jgi:hypothetical protein
VFVRSGPLAYGPLATGPLATGTLGAMAVSIFGFPVFKWLLCIGPQIGKLNFLCFFGRGNIFSFFFFGGGGPRSILEVKLVAKLNISLFLVDGLLFSLHFLLLFFGLWGTPKRGLSFLFFFLLGYGDLKLVN